MRKKTSISFIVFILIFTSIIVGCSSEKERPDDVRESIWYNGKEVYIIMRDAMQESTVNFGSEKAQLTRNERLKIMNFKEAYEDAFMGNSVNYTPTESEIVTNIYFMTWNYDTYRNEKSDESLKNFNELVKEMKNIFGE